MYLNREYICCFTPDRVSLFSCSKGVMSDGPPELEKKWRCLSVSDTGIWSSELVAEVGLLDVAES